MISGLVAEREMAYSRAELTHNQKAVMDRYYSKTTKVMFVTGLFVGVCMAASGLALSMLLQVI